jgi:DNA-binding NarL/FixJ family response regulator
MRVLIVADNPVSAEAIRREMRPTVSFKILGYVDGRRPCAAAVAEARPDVVMVDDMNSREAALASVREARAGAPDAKLVLLSGSMDAGWLAEASRAGIDAAVAKAVRPISLGALVREVVAGNVFQTFAQPTVPEQSVPPACAGLTTRELEILILVASGASNNRIASDLWVTEQTVKFHLSNVYRKLGVSNRTQASHYAHLHGLLEPEFRARTTTKAPVAVAA